MDINLLAGIEWRGRNDTTNTERLYDLNKDTEQYFQQLDKDRPIVFLANRHIENILNQSLPIIDISLLLSLIPYIETGLGRLSLKYVGETHRILRILRIIELEHQHQKVLFSSGCVDKESLIEKYMLSLFAFRRVLFQLSKSSVEEATYFLRQNKLSIIAVYVITQEDLIIPNPAFYHEIVKLYSDIWNDDDCKLLLSLTT